MSTLPPELDFSLNPEATPARMDKAMTYIVARFRPLEAQSTDYTVAINELQAFGLLRLNEALTPIFETGQQLADDLQAKHDEWYDNDLPNQLALQATATVIEEFEDYRHRYWGAFSSAPTVGPEEQTLIVGTMYFDTVIGRMRVWTGTQWLDAGSVVNAVLEHQSALATGGETSVTVPGGYDAGNIIVFLNGHKLLASDVVTTSGAQIGFIEPLSAGAEVSWTKFTTVTLANVYTRAQADARYTAADFSYSKSVSDATYATIATTYTRTAADNRYLRKDASLSDVADAAVARASIGALGRGQNLSDLVSIAAALANLGAGGGSLATGPFGSSVFYLPIEVGGARVRLKVIVGYASSVSSDNTTLASFPDSGFPSVCLGVFPIPRLSTWSTGSDNIAMLIGTPTTTYCEFGNQRVNGSSLLDIPYIAIGF